MSGGGGGSSNNGNSAAPKPAATTAPGYRPEMQTFAEADPGLLALLAQQMQSGFGGGLLNYQNDLQSMYSPVSIPILSNPQQYEAYAKNPLTQTAKTPPPVAPKPTTPTLAPVTPVAKPVAKKTTQSSIGLAAIRARQRNRPTSD